MPPVRRFGMLDASGAAPVSLFVRRDCSHMDRESTVSIIGASTIAAVLITLVLLGYRYNKSRVRLLVSTLMM